MVQTDYPTSDPYVTSVGGTTTGIDIAGKLVPDRMGHLEVQPVQDQRPGADRQPVPLRRRRRLLGVCSTGRLPERRHPAGESRRAAPSRTSRWTRTRPRACWSVRRRRSRTGSLRRVPDRWNQPGLAADGGDAGAGRAERGRQAGFANPAIYALARAARRRSPTTTCTQRRRQRAARLRQQGGRRRTGSCTRCGRSTRTAACSTRMGWDDVTGVGVPTPAYLTSLAKR